MKTKLTLALFAALALSMTACKKEVAECASGAGNCRAPAEQEVACGSSESDKCRSDQPGTVKACDDSDRCRTEEDKKKQLQRTDKPAAPKGCQEGENC